jgi:hypothetical protein
MTTAERHLLDYIAAYKPGSRMNPVPGMPTSHVPLSEAATLRGLIAKGFVRVVMKRTPRGELAYLTANVTSR